jgi:serine/threonine-protein kinase
VSDDSPVRDLGSATTSPASLEAPALFAPGERIAGVYDIRALLGEGGMARVFEAEDVTLARRVAIKVSRPAFDRAFLVNEARALASIRHPGLAAIHAFGEHRGTPFVVMERILGTTLDAHLARREREGSRMRVLEAIDVLSPLSEVLGALHGAGLVHRDVKPSNVMLAQGGRVVLMDFGLSVPEAKTKTKDAMPVGTPRYMAPETVTGDIEARTAYLVDVYALGVVAFELLAGELPFDGDGVMEVLKKHVGTPAPKLASFRDDVPAALSDLVDQMLAKDPVQRPSSMDAVGFRLKQVRARFAAPRDESPLVLVVEDDDAMARMLELLVKKSAPGVRVERAANGIDAMRIFAERAPTLMLLDLHMPQMSGIELGMYLRGSEIARTCTVVAVSAGASDADRELLQSLGVTRFIQKGTPKFNDRIVAEVRQVLEGT